METTKKATNGGTLLTVLSLLASSVSQAQEKSKFLNEISKCVLICSNCHRKIHKHNRSIEEQKLIMTT